MQLGNPSAKARAVSIGGSKAFGQAINAARFRVDVAVKSNPVYQNSAL